MEDALELKEEDEYEYVPAWCIDDSQTIIKKIQNRASCYFYEGTCGSHGNYTTTSDSMHTVQ